jgi:CPA1 family monovalent cation:H+ antiporter
MRGILTLAAAASIPEHTASGEEFPGRAAIQAIALFVTLGTLLLQGTTVGRLARGLKFDLTAERAATEAERERGRRIAAAAEEQPAADVDAGFEAQRLALGRAVRDHEVGEEIARELIEDIDLRQAARHTTHSTGPV